MRRRNAWVIALVGLAGVVAGIGGVFPYYSKISPSVAALRTKSKSSHPAWSASDCELAPGWTIRPVGRVPEKISSLVVSPRRGAAPGGEIYVGTVRAGGVYRLDIFIPNSFMTVADSLGDLNEFGECWVNRLAVRDLDGDGVLELIASTSQVFPRGRPRLYVWSLESPIPVLRSMARPDIRSSWSHGLGFLPRLDGRGESLFVTFCGYGEIVEYQYKTDAHEDGFRGSELSWKQIGGLPASGEWCQTADIDNDGQLDVCFSLGFAEKKAAIRSYTSRSRGGELEPRWEINEDHRFSNVRFLVGNLRDDGSNDVIAWWTTDHLNGGDCEVIRYHLTPQGIDDRQVIARGDAASLYPDDGQTALIDLDGDRSPEVWFGSKSGTLWRYDPKHNPAIWRVMKAPPALGPVAASPPDSPKPCLFLGWGQDVLRLDAISLQSSEATQEGSRNPRHQSETASE